MSSSLVQHRNVGREPLPEAPTLDWAIAYRWLGWSVLPVLRGRKRPAVAWQRFETELPNESEIRSWYARWPQAGVAIVTGRLSGVVVLDIDAGHGGEESFAQLKASAPEQFITAEATTGGGGRHLYFRHPGDLTPNRTGLEPGMDLRGDGGLVIAPPSIHTSGRRYAWRPGASPWDLPLAPLPPVLRVQETESHRGKPLHYWRELLREGVAIGQRNSTIASLAGHLFWRGVDHQIATELLLSWNRLHCRPPLSDQEVIETIDSIRRTHDRHLRPTLGQQLDARFGEGEQP